MKPESETNPQLDLSNLASSLTTEEHAKLITFIKTEISKDFILDENELIPASMTDEQAGEMKRKIFDSLKRSNLSADFIRFSTLGFAEVLKAILRPALSSSQPKRASGGGQ